MSFSFTPEQSFGYELYDLRRTINLASGNFDSGEFPFFIAMDTGPCGAARRLRFPPQGPQQVRRGRMRRCRGGAYGAEYIFDRSTKSYDRSFGINSGIDHSRLVSTAVRPQRTALESEK